ncbi:hypothetical protein PAQ31011_05104 [Pandoraea aquatica]|uniref:TrbC/VIRB2 family protein n=2 Tax=Pandoraea TaxID=93217 RepID=A0A5E4Z5N3_9BURK|nr:MULTISPECIES: hypothetical protein [Pandoraea]UVA77166.1 hypothetical protein NTU39_00080 [Pandoraea commovens]VVE56424.1 hypothetical protein PAQ31011_05104 [Pandoraea aquatica]
MKIEATQPTLQTSERSFVPVAALVLTVGAMLIAVGAMNGGTALAGSAWDAFVDTCKTVLGSTFIMALIMIALVVTLWQLAHGGGYRNISVLLGILVVGLIGPSLVQTVATATGTPIEAHAVTTIVTPQ